MSRYTTEVRFLCETLADLDESKGFDDIEDILTLAAPKIFDFDWPIFDEEYRLPLEIKILRYYYTREICEETVGLWKLRLENKLNLIMPYYNKLYDTTLIEFNPLYDVDLTTDSRRDVENDRNRANSYKNKEDNIHVSNQQSVNSGSNSSSESHSERGNDANTNRELIRASDTPQGAVGNLLDNTYLTNAQVNDHNGVNNSESSGSSSSSGQNDSERNVKGTETSGRDSKGNALENEKIKNVDDYLEHIVGTRGGITYAKKILDLRDLIVNIDRMIIEDLSTLFFGLWG